MLCVCRAGLFIVLELIKYPSAKELKISSSCCRLYLYSILSGFPARKLPVRRSRTGWYVVISICKLLSGSANWFPMTTRSSAFNATSVLPTDASIFDKKERVPEDRRPVCEDEEATLALNYTT